MVGMGAFIVYAFYHDNFDVVPHLFLSVYSFSGNWHRKRPIWVMLMVNSLTEGDIRSRGVPVLDLFLAQEATRLGKSTGAVERVEEQCLPLNRLNFSQVNLMGTACPTVYRSTKELLRLLALLSRRNSSRVRSAPK